MAEFQWWLLIVGLVAGGGLVAVVQMDSRRRDDDLAELEQRAEVTWITDRLPAAVAAERRTVEHVLRLHREYLRLPPPDRLVSVETGEDVEAPPRAPDPSDGDPDRMPDDVGDDRGSGADEDLAPAGEEQAATGQEAHAGADREQRPA
jgi:hypothetical protein